MTNNTMSLNDFQTAMNSDWWIAYEDNGTLTNGDETMSGWDMLAAIREADAWDQPVSATLPGLEAKDLLATLCDVLGVDWQDAYNRMEDMIESIQ